MMGELSYSQIKRHVQRVEQTKEEQLIGKVKFFDGTEDIERDLSPEVAMLLNSKIAHLQEQYNSRLSLLINANKQLRVKIG